MKKLLLAAALTLGFGTAGHATTVSYDVEASFSNASGGAVYNGGDTYGWGSCGLFPCPSTLKISDGSGSEDLANGNHDIDLFTLTWHNRTNLSSTQNGVDIKIDLDWTAPGTSSGTEKYTLAITNTRDGWLGLFPRADVIGPNLTTGPLQFAGLPDNLGGGVTVLGYSWSFSGAGSFAAGKWSNPEGGTAVATLVANVNVVPLPAAGWMLLAGLGGLGAMRRRKKAA